MNYRLRSNYSVILMSQRSNAPYRDEIQADGVTIHYEGHDAPLTDGSGNPKLQDQPRVTAAASLTQNGRFAEAVEQYKAGGSPELVKVYEKLFSGVWSFKGYFHLIDYSYQYDGVRRSFTFVLRLTQDPDVLVEDTLKERSRVIPTSVKKFVWERDGGRCVICGSTEELHFDHEIPFSKGGTSVRPENVRILCARHNLGKRDNIE